MTGWYRHGDLPPTGNPLLLRGHDPLPDFAGYSSHWVQSGTAALALALSMARAARPEVTAPVVLLPAYGCPDLVAAAEFAQVRPMLVDIAADDPGYSRAAVEAALTADVIAVVAVNFLGIRERLIELRDLLVAARSPALLIEDDAQWFPEPVAHHRMVGDLVCLSFGRGKPVSLLGGGALLVRDSCGLRVPDLAIGRASPAGFLFPLKARVFNVLLDRRCYWLINRNPAFSLGQTVFKPLLRIDALGAERLSIVGANVDAYMTRARDIEAMWTTSLQRSGAVVPLPVATERVGRLLRYPILCRNASMRDTLLARLHQAGLGATAMYRCPLAQVSGVGDRVRIAGTSSGASAFAARLLTLPTHDQTTQRDVDNAVAVLDD